jgi:hypothetical protein
MSFMAATTSTKKRFRATGRKPRKWSARVMQKSNALDLESKIFKSGSAEKIARSLKRSAERSKRKKGTPFQSAMSMLNFYINRAGKNLSARQKNTLEKTKDKLRQLFGRSVKKE